MAGGEERGRGGKREAEEGRRCAGRQSIQVERNLRVFNLYKRISEK